MTIYLSDADLAAARDGAHASGTSLSRWVAQAIRRESGLEEAIRVTDEVLAEIEAVHGPPTKEDLEWVQRAVDGLGPLRRGPSAPGPDRP